MGYKFQFVTLAGEEGGGLLGWLGEVHEAAFWGRLPASGSCRGPALPRPPSPLHTPHPLLTPPHLPPS